MPKEEVGKSGCDKLILFSGETGQIQIISLVPKFPKRKDLFGFSSESARQLEHYSEHNTIPLNTPACERRSLMKRL